MLMIGHNIHKNSHVYFFFRTAIDNVGVLLHELAELGRFAADAIKGGTVSFFSWYRDGRLLAINPQFEKLAGYPEMSLTG